MNPFEDCPSLLSYQATLMTPPETAMVEKKCWPVVTSLTCIGLVQVIPPFVDSVNMTLELPLPKSSQTMYTPWLSEASWGVVNTLKKLAGSALGRMDALEAISW